MWLRPERSTDGINGEGNTSDLTQVLLVYGTPDASFRITLDSTLALARCNSSLALPFDLVPNAWTHVAISVSATDEVQAFANGRIAATGVLHASDCALPMSATLQLGRGGSLCM